MEGNDKGVKMKIHYAKIVLLFIFVICLININACQKCDPTDDIKRIAQEEAEKAAKQAIEKIEKDMQDAAEIEYQKKKNFIIKAIIVLIIVIGVAVLLRYGIRKNRKNLNIRK